MRAAPARVALGATLCVLAGLLAVLIRHTEYRHHALWLYCLSVPLFSLAVVLLARCRVSRNGALLVIFGAGVVFQVIAISQHTTTTDDDYRYMWDAKVQLAGVDPYRYAPVAPQLDGLREEYLFPARCADRVPYGCTTINRPTVHTVYPPVAEAAFVIIRLVSFGGQGHHFPVQLAGALAVIAIGALLARRVLARGQPPWLVAVWLWCPLPIMEYSNAGHIDWLAVLLTVIGLSIAGAHRTVAGLLVGAAIATKLYPALVLPALLRRRPVAVLGASIGFVALVYLPHVLAVGTGVIGYLPGYLREEQYTSGGRLLLLGAVLPHPIDAVVGALLLGAVAWWAYRRADPEVPEARAVVMTGSALLIATPVYGWYAGLLLALIVMSGALEWLPVALAPTLIYLIQGEFGLHPGMARLVYAVAGALTLTAHVLRRTTSSSLSSAIVQPISPGEPAGMPR